MLRIQNHPTADFVLSSTVLQFDTVCFLLSTGNARLLPRPSPQACSIPGPRNDVCWIYKGYTCFPPSDITSCRLLPTPCCQGFLPGIIIQPLLLWILAWLPSLVIMDSCLASTPCYHRFLPGFHPLLSWILAWYPPLVIMDSCLFSTPFNHKSLPGFHPLILFHEFLPGFQPFTATEAGQTSAKEKLPAIFP